MDYRKLNIWKESLMISKDVYMLTRELPKEEKYGLISQLTRAVTSISSNIAEGSGRNHTSEFVQFLGIARGSLCEVSSQLELIKLVYPDLSVKCDLILKKLDTLSAMIYKFLISVRSSMESNRSAKRSTESERSERADI